MKKTNQTALTLIFFAIVAPQASVADQHAVRYSCRAGGVPLVITKPQQQTRQADFGQAIDLLDSQHPMPITSSSIERHARRHDEFLILTYKDAKTGAKRVLRINISNPQLSKMELASASGAIQTQLLSCEMPRSNPSPACSVQDAPKGTLKNVPSQSPRGVATTASRSGSKTSIK